MNTVFALIKTIKVEEMQNKIKNLKEHCIMFYLIVEAATSDSVIYLSSHVTH